MNIQSISFGKTPVMTCTVKGKGSRVKQNATLYKMDTKNDSDCKEILYSKNAKCMLAGLEKDMSSQYPVYNYYLLKNDKTQEVISCAQTSRHYRTGNAKYQGLSTQIEEMAENNKYANGAEPLFAYLAKNSGEFSDECILTAFDQDEITSSLKRSKFSQLKTGEWVLPKKRYQALIEQAEKREDVNFIA